MLYVLDVNAAQPSNFGNSYELYAIAAAVLGGCSLRGGEGSITGVVIGTAVIVVLRNTINLVFDNQNIEFAIIGGVILIGVIVDELARRLVAARREATRHGK
jgi:ribose transport system permease protein